MSNVTVKIPKVRDCSGGGVKFNSPPPHVRKPSEWKRPCPGRLIQISRPPDLTISQTRVNRTTELVRAILNKAMKEWKWIDSTPHIRRFKESNQRLRWLTHDEANRLMAEQPEHTKAMALFTLATGLRESNVTHLEWSQIDMQRRIAWIHADQAKAGKTIHVPLNDDAIAVLRSQIGNHSTRFFTYRGRPIEKAGMKYWRIALKRAGIEGFTWHGLRHTWASWHVQSGTPLNVLQELGGWSSYDMVLRYAHLAPDHLSEYASNVSGIVANRLQPNNVTVLKTS